jgi:hypothetical protein
MQAATAPAKKATPEPKKAASRKDESSGEDSPVQVSLFRATERAMQQSTERDFETTEWQRTFSFFASQTLHNIKILKKNSGAVNDEANFFCF